jgi:hypothetical protein
MDGIEELSSGNCRDGVPFGRPVGGIDVSSAWVVYRVC